MLVANTCCHLLRLDCSARLSLPLARRSRVEFSNHPSSLLCANCTAIKEQQQLNILRTQPLNRLASVDARREIEFSLLDEREKRALTTTSNYQSGQMLLWQVNSSTSRHGLDTGALTEDEKKILLNETIKKLQAMLSHPSSTPTDLTRHALETSIRILSSSIDSS